MSAFAPKQTSAACLRCDAFAPQCEGRSMKRREFITLLGGATAWPLAARPQANKMWRIGCITHVPVPVHEALFERLRELGYVEGQNTVIERRYAQGGAEKFWHKVDISRPSSNVRFGGKADMPQCPLFPRKRTLIERVGMSALCQKQTFRVAVKNVAIRSPRRRRSAGAAARRDQAHLLFLS